MTENYKDLVDNETVFEIHGRNVDRLKDAIESLATKAEAWGLEPPSFEILGTGTRPIFQGAGPARMETGFTEPVAWVRITGESPVLPGGWTFVAVIDHTEKHEDLGYLIARSPFAPPDLEIPQDYRFGDNDCDHCGYARKRKQTFLIINDDGEWKKVGRDCLKDFLGHADPASLARWMYSIRGLIADLRDDYDLHDVDRREYLDLKWYLERCAIAIRTWGFTSKSKAREATYPVTATADIAMPPSNPEDDDLEGLGLQEDEDAAVEAIAWAREVLPEIADNDYLINLAIAMDADYVHWKRTGLVASVFAAMDKVAEMHRRETEPKPDSEWVGDIGERIEVEVTQIKVKKVDAPSRFYNQSDVLKIYIFQDDDENQYVWFTRTWTEANDGDRLKIRATVKDHNEWQGVKQTAINRVYIYCTECGSKRRDREDVDRIMEITGNVNDLNVDCYHCKRLELEKEVAQ